MPKNSVDDWDTSSGNNTDIAGINIAEGCAPQNINDALRTVMSQVADWRDTLPTLAGSDTISGDWVFTGSPDFSGVANASTIRTDLGLEIGADVQAYSATLTSIGAVTGAAAGDVLYYDGTDWAAVTGGTAGQVLAMNSGGTALEWVSPITNGTEQATTSGTTFDFTGIPAESMFIKMKLSGVSLSSNALFLIQLGTSGGIVTSGYQGGGGIIVNTTADETGETSGAVIRVGNSGRTCSGTLTFSRVSPGSHKWTASYSAGAIGAQYFGGCDIDLGAEVTQIRLTSSDGAAFDAGAVNVSAGRFA